LIIYETALREYKIQLLLFMGTDEKDRGDVMKLLSLCVVEPDLFLFVFPSGSLFLASE